MKENENIWSKMEFIVNRSNRLWHTGSRSLDVRCFLLHQRKLPQCRWWGMEPQVGTASDQRVWLVMARHPGVLKWQLNDSASSLMTLSFRDNYMWMKTAKLVFFQNYKGVGVVSPQSCTQHHWPSSSWCSQEGRQAVKPTFVMSKLCNYSVL